MVFVMGTVGILTLLSCLIVLLHKTAARAREQRELQNQLQTISELLDSNNHRNDEPLDEPPLYEAPPEYEQIYVETEKHRKKEVKPYGKRSLRKKVALEIVLHSGNEVISDIENNGQERLKSTDCLPQTIGKYI